MPSRGFAGSFSSIPHDNQPLNTGHSDALGNFSSTPLAILQPRTADCVAVRPKRCCAAASESFSDLLPGSVADLVGMNPPYSKTFQGGLLGTVGGTAIAPGVPDSAIDATVAANQAFTSGLPQGQLSCASPLANRIPAFAVRSPPCRMASCMRLTSWSGASPSNINSERRPSLRAQYVGHARGEPALHNPGQRLPDGVSGLLCAIPLRAADRSAIRRGDTITTGANSHYNGLQTDRREAARARLARPGQLHLEPLHGYGLERRLPAVLRGRDSFASAGDLGRDMVPAITTCGTTSPPSMYISCRSECAVLWATR